MINFKLPAKDKRYFCKGRPEKSEEIKDYFKSIGAKVNGINFTLDYTHVYYTIIENHELIVAFNCLDSVVTAFLLENYKYITLPYKPKEGEACIGLFNGVKYCIVGHYHTASDNDDKGCLVRCIDNYDNIDYIYPDSFAPLNKLINILNRFK